MKTVSCGLIWALTFVVLEAAQAVFFGGVFQDHSTFVIGAAVFGVSTVGTLSWMIWRDPAQLSIAWQDRGNLIGLNLSTVGVWIAYFLALQMIEPAVVFTVFSGLVPVALVVGAAFSLSEEHVLQTRAEGLGMALVILSIVILTVVTLLGLSGFVRGGWGVALLGLTLSVASSVSFAAMMIFSERLDRHGVGPVAQFGLRFPLYVAVSLVGVCLGFDAKGPVDFNTLLPVILIGLAIIAFPLFAMQKAISLMRTMSLAIVTALGPLFVFFFQILEDRVTHAPATMAGLIIYFLGALLFAYGGTRNLKKGAARS